MFYLFSKTLHLIAVISWMAGLLYLPRLFIYHYDAQGQASETFKTMERRLYRFIMMPAMVVTLLTGFFLGYELIIFKQIWLHVKLLCVLGLLGAHFLMGSYIKAFARDERPHTTRYFRIFNEIPTILMIIIVILVVFKP